MEILACPRIPVAYCEVVRTPFKLRPSPNSSLQHFRIVDISPKEPNITVIPQSGSWEFFWYSLVLKLKIWDEAYFQVLTEEHYNTVYHVQLCALNFALYRAMYHQVFFQHETSSESNYNRNIWGQSPGLINWFQSCSSSARILPLNCRILFEWATS